ncbi:hypothetical protein EcCFBP13530_23915 [Enterobacter cancerogenus]|uniref:Uncharacterized protein n=1 Tax=Enterobacter cancerogenus TaxID=69218 RepID=A0AB38NY07_9ENTR|nr:hypothetical protein [Enterobacter cancerogenus]TKK12363.1 hypothetical protein EcCFBP13530_23915 [Enterobacter cancerogenus]
MLVKIFAVLMIASVLAMFVGLIKPRAVGLKARWKVIVVYPVSAIVFMLALGWQLSVADEEEAEARAAQAKHDLMMGQVCRATVSMLMGGDVKTIGVDRHSGSTKDRVVHVSYVRESDNKRWFQKCKVEGNHVIWASDMPNEGYHRWRNHPADEKFEFKLIEEGRFIIKMDNPDGSSDSKEFLF